MCTPYIVLLLFVLIASIHGQRSVSLKVLKTKSTTPLAKIGLNSGHGCSNAFTWWKRSGVTAGRLFATGEYSMRTAIGSDVWGLRQNDSMPITSRSLYESGVVEIRKKAGHTFPSTMANPFPWDKMTRKLNDVKTGSEYLGIANQTITNLVSLGIDPLILIKVTCDSATILDFTSYDTTAAAYWKERYELYRWFYMFSQWTALLGVKNIEIYNEPDLDSCMNNAGWIDNVLIRAAAIRDSYADFNTERSKNVTVLLYGPATAKGLTTYSTNDISDGALNYGKIAMLMNHRKFPNNDTDLVGWNNLDIYSYHVYDKDGSAMRRGNDGLAAAASADNGKAISVALTEFNPHSSSKWDDSYPNTTIDDARWSARIASQLLWSMPTAKALYAFKFSQNTNDGTDAAVTKNGLLWADNDGPSYSIGDSTRAFEAFALVARRVKNATIYPLNVDIVTADSVNSTAWLALEDAKNYFFLLSNDENATLAVTLNLSNLTVGASDVIVTHVSDRYLAEVVSTAPLPTNKSMAMTLPAYTVVQLSIPKSTTTRSKKVFNPSADNTVKAGAKVAVINATATTLEVRTANGSVHDTTAVSFLTFAFTTATSTIYSALLSLRVSAVSGSNPVNVITILGSTSLVLPSENTLNWNNAPLLKPNATIDKVSKNFIDWTKFYSTTIVGHITVPPRTPAGTILTVDVTDYVKAGGKMFALYRPWRRDAAGSTTKPDNLTDTGVIFDSRSATTANRPTLKLYV